MSEESEPEKFRKLFIRGLDKNSTTEESLKSHFQQWGEILDCTVMRNPHTGKSRGFGFVTYKSAHMVDDAQAARIHIIDGRVVKTKRAVPEEDSGKVETRVSVDKLYVSGINEDMGEEDLREYFGPYGNIVSVKVVIDKNTSKKSFAIVKFDDYDPVDKILMLRHNYKDRELEVKKGLSRKKRDSIKMEKEIGGYGRRRGGGLGEWCTADEFDKGGYARRNGCGDSCYRGRYDNGAGRSNDGYGYSYRSGGGGGNWVGTSGSSYGGGPIRSNTGYVQHSRGPYGGGRGSGGYGQR